MVSILNLSELDFRSWRMLIDLYLENPLEHVYVFYDSIYENDKTNIFLKIDEDIKGYLLIWRGYRLSIHIWGSSVDLIKYIPTNNEMLIQVYIKELLEEILNYIGLYGDYEVKYYLNMVVDEKDFNPYIMEEAIKLDPNRDINSFLQIKDIQGRYIEKSDAYNMIKKSHYYGVFKDRKLVSIACAYLKTPEIWVIGDVYTHPDYRNKGYAKIVTSAITRDAVRSGALAMLHVDKDNISAIRVYKRLGYKIFSERPWIFYKPKNNSI